MDIKLKYRNGESKSYKARQFIILSRKRNKEENRDGHKYKQLSTSICDPLVSNSACWLCKFQGKQINSLLPQGRVWLTRKRMKAKTQGESEQF